MSRCLTSLRQLAVSSSSRSEAEKDFLSGHSPERRRMLRPIVALETRMPLESLAVLGKHQVGVDTKLSGQRSRKAASFREGASSRRRRSRSVASANA